MENKDFHDIDRMFSDHFQGTKVPVEDKEQLWENIQSNRKRRSGIYWPLAGILLLVASSAFAWMHFQESETLMADESFKTRKEIFSSETQMEQLPLEEEKLRSMDEAMNNQEKKITSQTVKRIEENVLTNERPSGDISVKSITGEEQLMPVLSKEKDSAETLETKGNDIGHISKLGAIPLAQIAKNEMEGIHLELLGAGPDWDKCWVRPRGQWFLDAYAQFGIPLEDIQFTGEASGYAKDWEQQFDPAYSYHGGLMIGRQFHWNGYLAAGLEYQQFQTEHLNELRIIETIQIYDPRAYFTVDENGERQYIGDTVTVTNIRDEIERSANNYKMLHLPIHLGYRSKGKYWRYGIDFSALINLSFNYEGVFLRADGAVVEVDESNQSDYFVDGMGTSFSAALHLGRMVGDRTELYLQPRFRFNSQNYHNGDTGLSIKRNFAGLRVGLRYYLE
ncbi:MAG TPA: hypothetical protein VJ917_09245 [Saprospiraceae bacterium]|nr:hypothetical protein [Saprospiraceae bacterium]